MSTKIFHAFKYYGPVEELWPMLQSFGKVIWDATLAHLEGVVDYTNKDIGLFDWGRILDSAMEDFQHGAFNVQCCAVVYVHPNVAGTLVQFFGLDTITGNLSIDGWLTAKLPEVFPPGMLVDWHFQNQTDKPEEVTEAEWEQRENDWDLIYKDTRGSAPKNAGLTVHYIEHGDGINLLFDLHNRWQEWLTIQVACPVCSCPMAEIVDAEADEERSRKKVSHMECPRHGAPTRAMMVEGLGNKPMPPIDPLPDDEEEPQDTATMREARQIEEPGKQE